MSRNIVKIIKLKIRYCAQKLVLIIHISSITFALFPVQELVVGQQHLVGIIQGIYISGRRGGCTRVVVDETNYFKCLRTIIMG
jgi:hypothetical protein